MTYAKRPQVKTGTRCPECGLAPKAVEVIIQARSLDRTKKMTYHGTRSRRLCEGCARRVFSDMEDILDGGA